MKGKRVALKVWVFLQILYAFMMVGIPIYDAAAKSDDWSLWDETFNDKWERFKSL